LESAAITTDSNLEREQKRAKSLEKERNASQEALGELKKIINKSKKGMLGSYSVSVDDMKLIEQILNSSTKG
jgi:hypothetical protein